MYCLYFGLQRPPFRVTPDSSMFYPGGNRGAVLEALVYAIGNGEGIVKVVGEVGSGKTMLCRMLASRLPPTVDIIYLANPSLSPDNILHAIALELGLPVAESPERLRVMHALQQCLVRKHAQGRRVVMFVEEAQSMPPTTMEEIRLLSNLETQQDKLLQIVLFGQPELDRLLGRRDMRQLRERIAFGFHLQPLQQDEIREYLNTRLRASGYRAHDLFSPDAVQSVARASRGLLRRINILADKALLATYAAGKMRVGSQEVRRAVRDSEFGGAALLAWPSLSVLMPLSAGFVLVMLLAGLQQQLQHLPRSQGARPTPVPLTGQVQHFQDAVKPVSSTAISASDASQHSPASSPSANRVSAGPD
jgi:type II secretory pathway predicted ATPase ExeA